MAFSSIPRPIDHHLYDEIHYWLKHNYGKATRCEDENCSGKNKRYEWAKVRGKKYAKKRGNFIQLCRSCHRRYDLTEGGRKRLSDLYKGKRLPEKAYMAFRERYTGVPRPKEVVRKISAALMGRKLSLSHRLSMSRAMNKTHCKRGHEFNETNTIHRTQKRVGGGFQRMCRPCKRLLDSLAYQRAVKTRKDLTTLGAGDNK